MRIRKLSESNDLTACKIEEIMSEEKPNQIEKIKINSNRLMKVLPKNITGEKQIEDFIIKCIENNNRRNRLNRYIER